MSEDGSLVYHSCENGHPVLEGSTICTRCGAQVTDRVVKGPRASRVKAATSASEADTESPAARPRNPVTLAVSLGIGIAILGAASIIAFSAESTSNDSPGDTGPLLACGGIAQAEIGLNSEYPQSHAIVCFTVNEETTITIGATPSGDADLTLDIRTESGTFWAGNDDTYGQDPEVTSLFLPGTYVVTVGEYDGDDPGAFTLYTRSEPVSPWPPDDVGDLPDSSACGTPGTPLLVGSGELSLDSDTAFVCVQIDSRGFIKFGASATPNTTADLRLAVHVFDDSGLPSFIQSVDNTFGMDPEMSLVLDAGLYLVEVDTWNAAPVGPFTLYVSTTPTYFRQGEVAEQFSAVRAQECTDGTLRSISYGETLTIPPGETPMVCLTLTATSRMELAALSRTDEDLTLEIIGFTPEGTPVRFGWVDYDPWAGIGIDIAQVDLALPAGTYILAAARYDGDPPLGAFDFSFS